MNSKRLAFTAALGGLLMLAAAFQNFSSTKAPYYLLDFETGQLTADGSYQLPSGRKFTYKKHSDEFPPKIAFYKRFNTALLWFDIAPTKAGQTKNRSEYTIYSGLWHNQTWYNGFKFLLPAGNPNPTAWNIIFQCPQHDTGKDGKPAVSPPLSMGISDKGELYINIIEDYSPVKKATAGVMATYVKKSVPVSLNRLYDVVVRFQMGSKGNYLVKLDGKTVLQYSGPIGYKPGGLYAAAKPGEQQGCTSKFGVYRAASAVPFRILFDDIRLGPSLESVTDISQD